MFGSLLVNLFLALVNRKQLYACVINVLVPQVEEAIKHLKLNKALITDGVSVELIKGLGDGGTKILHFIKIWKTAIKPKEAEDKKNSIMRISKN